MKGQWKGLELSSGTTECGRRGAVHHPFPAEQVDQWCERIPVAGEVVPAPLLALLGDVGGPHLLDGYVLVEVIAVSRSKSCGCKLSWSSRAVPEELGPRK